MASCRCRCGQWVPAGNKRCPSCRRRVVTRLITHTVDDYPRSKARPRPKDHNHKPRPRPKDHNHKPAYYEPRPYRTSLSNGSVMKWGCYTSLASIVIILIGVAIGGGGIHTQTSPPIAVFTYLLGGVMFWIGVLTLIVGLFKR